MNEKIDTAGFNIGNIAGNGKTGNLPNMKGMKGGNWSYFFSLMVRFEENGQNFLFSHSADENKIKLSSLTSEGEGQVFIDDKWHWYYNSQVPFIENGKNYMFCYSNRGNRWFISELSTKWDGQKEIKNGQGFGKDRDVMIPFNENSKNYIFAHSSSDKSWFMTELPTNWDGKDRIKEGCQACFCRVLIPFVENGRSYLFAHSARDNRWFVSELFTKWNGQSELRCSNWARYYPSVTAFVHFGKPIAYFHSEKDRRWFMWELFTNRRTGKGLNNGNLDSFYDTVISFKENQACYILAQSSETKEFFICPVLQLMCFKCYGRVLKSDDRTGRNIRGSVEMCYLNSKSVPLAPKVAISKYCVNRKLRDSSRCFSYNHVRLRIRRFGTYCVFIPQSVCLLPIYFPIFFYYIECNLLFYS